MIVVTHYQRLLDYIVPDFVHVLSDGRIVKSGGKELALELEAGGYAGWGFKTKRRRLPRMTAVAEQTGLWLTEFTKQPAGGAVDSEVARRRLRAVRRSRLPHYPR